MRPSIMMTQRFLRFLPYIFQWECTYDARGNVVCENDPDDPGGETKYGIDKRSHPEVDVQALDEARAAEIYWREYWVKYGCEWLAKPLGEVFFNACVNCGPARARAILQATAVPHSAAAFLGEQEAFYRRLAAARPRLKKFLNGWLDRTAQLRKLAEHWGR